MPAETPPTSRRRGLTMSQWVLIALVGGIFCGLFFGESAGKVKFIGDIYVGLLQMMVLPYILLSLIGGIGRLTILQAKQLVKYSVLGLLVIWALMGVITVLLPLSYPQLESASFFSSSILQTPQSPDYLGIFIPDNIFASLTDSEVPAIVLFCLTFGAALITVKDKEPLFSLVRILSDAVLQVIKVVVKLAPLGVAAMTAAAAGTMTLQEIERLQGYLIVYTWAILLLGFCIVPGLISCMTPFRYKDIIAKSWPAIVLAFVTAKTLVALPLIIEGLKDLFEKSGLDDQEAVNTAEVMAPIIYPFPLTGRLLILQFPPFAAWFLGNSISLGDYPKLYISGLFSLFGNVAVAIPFLLSLVHIPTDMFQLFILTGVFNSRLSNGLGAMDMFAIVALTACAVCGRMNIQWRRLVVISVVSALILTAGITATRTYLGLIFKGSYTKNKVLASMQLPPDLVKATIVPDGPNPVPLKPGQSRLDRAQQRGLIRIGFDSSQLPFSYINHKGEVVGYDVNMAHQLASTLGVNIEFTPIDRHNFLSQLEKDHFDIAMAGMPADAFNISNLRYSNPYIYLTMALVAPDYRQEFASLDKIQKLKKFKIGLCPYFKGSEKFILSLINSYIPDAEIVILDSYEEFYQRKGRGRDVDALFTSAEAGSSWTLVYPEFQVYTPLGKDISLPLVYPFSLETDDQMSEFLNHWILLTQHDGTQKRIYNYWILGQGGEKKTPRWSIIRNVLHWTD